MKSIPQSPDWEHELAAQQAGYMRICGIDEAGRGPLAGPVLAAAVILPTGYQLEGLTDSKKLSAKKREALYARLTEDPRICYAIAEASVAEIDKLNILRATHLAMARAAQALPEAADFALIDGLAVPQFPLPSQNIIKGDSRSLSIAAASILAKVSRDRIMHELDKQHPEYGFARHSGYGTRQHMKAIQDHGITPHHRLSFAPVAQKSLPLEF